MILGLAELDGTTTTHICRCIEQGTFAPDGCCLLIGVACRVQSDVVAVTGSPIAHANAQWHASLAHAFARKPYTPTS